MPERYVPILQHLPDIIYKLDRAGKFIYLNNSIRKLGYEPADLLDKHFSTIIHPDDINMVQRDIAVRNMTAPPAEEVAPPGFFDERRTGDRITKNLFMRLLPNKYSESPAVREMDQSFFEVMSIGSYDFIEDNTQGREFNGTLGVIRTVAEPETEDSSAADYLQYFGTVIENTSKVITILAADGSILYVSPSITGVMGYNPGYVTGTNIWKYICSDDIRDLIVSYKEATAISPVFKAECRIAADDESWKTMMIEGKVLFDRNGKTLCIVAVSRDITSQKMNEESVKRAFEYMEERILERSMELAQTKEKLRVETELRKKKEALLYQVEKKYRTLINSIEEIVFNLDSDETITYISPAIRTIAGYEPEEVTGNYIADYIHKDDRGGYMDYLRTLRHLPSDDKNSGIGYTGVRHEMRMLRRNGTYAPLEIRCRAIKKGNGSVLGYSGIAVDVTRRKKSDSFVTASKKSSRTSTG